jgi:hypothetical protein
MAKKLIRESCCNYAGGNCLVMENEESTLCPQSMSHSVSCKWFRWAVLPQNKALEAEIFQIDHLKRCAECGQAFVPKSNRAKYCESCAAKVHRRQKAASERKRRWSVDK